MKKQVIKAGFLFFTGLFLTTSVLFSQNSNFHIYLCFGQSNMQGQGPVQTQDKSVDSRFKTYQAQNCSNLSRVKGTWYTAVPPTCQCYSNLSPADYFGRTMVANLPDSITVGIINVSVGGCDIRLFDKDIYQDYDSTYTESWFTSMVAAYNWNPYQYLVDLAKSAQNDGVIKGILLHQGETNTGNNLWPSYVKKIYTDMLADLGLCADSVPLLAGEVLSAPGNCCSSMNPVINRLPDTIPTAYVISSAGCPALDAAHFNSEGNRLMGRRYAVQMLSIMGYECDYAEAECGSAGSGLSVKSDINASNSSYVTMFSGNEKSTTVPLDDAGSVIMNVNVKADTNYYIYGRFNNANTGSFWLKIDDGELEWYENLTTEGWEWKELKNLNLTAGEHTIRITFAEDSVMLDKIAVKNAQITPVGAGEEAEVVCIPDITSGQTDTFLKGYALEQNYPNPVSENNTNIAFRIPDAGFVSLKVFNTLGMEMDELAGKFFFAGEHHITCNLEKLTPGIYFYTLKTDEYEATRKMIKTEIR